MQPTSEDSDINFDYQLDPSKPLVLLLGWIDHEGILSSLKTSGRQYKKKILNSYPENWTATADLFDQYKISSVVGKLPAEVLQLIVNKNYHAVRERLFGAIGSVPNQIYLFEDILAGEQSDKFREEYKPFPAPAILKEALTFLRQHNIEVIPYARKAEVTVLADAFLDDTNKNLIFRLYVPTSRLWSGEADRFLQLFQDYLVKVEQLKVRLDQKRTEHGVVYEFHGHPSAGQHTLAPEFQEFSKLMALFQTDADAATALIASKGGNPKEVLQLVARYAKEARRLQLDIKHEAETKAIAIRHRLESELIEYDLSPDEWAQLPALVSQAVPKITDALFGETLYLGRPSPATGGPAHVTYNFRPQFINTVNGVIAEEINGNQHFEPEHHQLLELVAKHGELQAKTLETAIYEIADKGVDKVDRLKAKQRLTAFLIEVGKKTGDLAFGVLQSYIEKQLGL
ncbi:MAG: hypothetical protein ABS37_03650 [Acidovorax sp. SCN 65-108]|nr:MAG: hypothetical protein ABS37_03650 [Acidovorax sp. SCN 65-108]OJV70841.1 MAG: hypothetical protein BGO35_19780 [Burkholderiales bacterium 64-34]